MVAMASAMRCVGGGYALAHPPIAQAIVTAAPNAILPIMVIASFLWGKRKANPPWRSASRVPATAKRTLRIARRRGESTSLLATPRNTTRRQRTEPLEIWPQNARGRRLRRSGGDLTHRNED